MPKKIYEGSRFDCVLCDDALSQADFTEESLPSTILDVDCTELFDRIIRYCNTGKLREPMELNSEVVPFFAIKTQPPESLRAYFRHCDVVEKHMVVTHFAIKTTQKLTQGNKTRMQLAFDDYSRQGGV